MKLFDKFYLDKEHDIIVNLYKNCDDGLTYIIETPSSLYSFISGSHPQKSPTVISA